MLSLDLQYNNVCWINENYLLYEFFSTIVHRISQSLGHEAKVLFSLIVFRSELSLWQYYLPVFQPVGVFGRKGCFQ